MKAFIAVYQHSFRDNRVITQTSNRNKGNNFVKKYIDAFNDEESYLDWADDPSFFCAQEILGDVRRSSWGVCRRDVRNQLRPGDLVVFFCGKQNFNELKEWKYYFIGYGTVKETISRERIWEDKSYSQYCSFFNILARPTKGKLEQYELIGDGHDDWKKRITAPYIIFDSDPKKTNFNMKNPLLVALKSSGKVLEEWNYEDTKVKTLRYLLFDQFGITRHLRTNNLQRAHRHIVIHNVKPVDKMDHILDNLTEKLYEFVINN